MQSEVIHPAAVMGHLFANPELAVYAILDGASVPDLLGLFERFDPEYVCLYRGEMEPDVEEVAPYLVKLERNGRFTQHVLQRGWGQHWGVFVLLAGGVGLSALRRHLRRFLIVHDPDGRPLYFRYYDPRVLRVFLPICEAEQIAEVFGPVAAYAMEDREPSGLLRFHVSGGRVVLDKHKLVEE